MWFSLFSLVLILCVAFFQALQGLFSAVIMCVLTILSAALAFGTYENLFYGPLLAPMPDYGEAVALFGIFIVTLIVLRTLFDNVIKGNMQFPVWVDRIGGGALGLVSALIIVGMLQLAFQLLPFDGTFLGFNRFVPISTDRRAELSEDDLKKRGPDAVAWRRESLCGFLKPDEFAVGLVSLLSDGALSGNTRFRDVHPDFAAEVQNSRSSVQRESRHALTAVDALQIVPNAYWVLPPGRLMRFELTPDAAGNDVFREQPTPQKEGDEFRVYHVLLDEPARDTDSQIRFKPSQVRVVGHDRQGGAAAEYILKGIQKNGAKSQFIELFRDPVLGKNECSSVIREARGPNKTPFDFIFEVPKTFQADFIEFKRTARADASAARAKPEKELVEPAPAPKPKPKEANASTIGEPPAPPNGGASSSMGESKDRISGVWISAAPVFADRMPLKLAGGAGELEIENGKVMGGHCAVPVTPENIAQSDADRLPFDIPEGRHLLFVPLQELDPQSFLGAARGFAQRALPTITLKLEDGKLLKPVGKYAFAKIGGQWWFECTYLNETARDADRDIPIFDKIKHADLTQPTSQYIYLFLVPSGSKVAALDRAKAEPIDLKKFNLESPR